jgi:hypothetical protein
MNELGPLMNEPHFTCAPGILQAPTTASALLTLAILNSAWHRNKHATRGLSKGL